jgi:AP-3 complex subunit beta
MVYFKIFYFRILNLFLAFEQTCPDRLDLLHRHFRPLCRALVDIDEWGQIVMVGLLTRYARTQFTSPKSNKDGKEPILDPDHNLLIQSTRPLLQSRNCAVVTAVAQLLYYTAPTSQLHVIPRALIRLLRGTNEVQHIVLTNIATICANQQQTLNSVEDEEEKFPNEHSFSQQTSFRSLFEPYLKSFFIRSSDTVHVKKIKLHILTSLVSNTNSQLVIRELQVVISGAIFQLV